MGEHIESENIANITLDFSSDHTLIVGFADRSGHYFRLAYLNREEVVTVISQLLEWLEKITTKTAYVLEGEEWGNHANL